MLNENLLAAFNMENCNPVSTPADSNSRLTVSQHPLHLPTKFPYRNAVGALIHLCVTRPDFSFAVGQVEKYSK